MNSRASSRNHRSSRRGLTLVELLITMGIIALLLVAASQFRSPPAARPVDAMNDIAGLLRIARAEALAKGMPTRVAICTHGSEGERFLRYAVRLENSGVGWKLVDRGRRLPEGTIFWPKFSTSPEDQVTSMGFDLDVHTPQDGLNGPTFAFIEFSAIGEPSEPGTQWAFARAIPDATGAAPVVPNELDRDAFIIRRTGRLSIFEDPAQISNPL